MIKPLNTIKWDPFRRGGHTTTVRNKNSEENFDFQLDQYSVTLLASPEARLANSKAAKRKRLMSLIGPNVTKLIYYQSLASVEG